MAVYRLTTAEPDVRVPHAGTTLSVGMDVPLNDDRARSCMQDN